MSLNVTQSRDSAIANASEGVGVLGLSSLVSLMSLNSNLSLETTLLGLLQSPDQLLIPNLL
jgi:hypothetical protein